MLVGNTTLRLSGYFSNYCAVFSLACSRTVRCGLDTECGEQFCTDQPGGRVHCGPRVQETRLATGEKYFGEVNKGGAPFK